MIYFRGTEDIIEKYQADLNKIENFFEIRLEKN